MAYSYHQIIQDHYEQLQGEYAEANAELEAGRQSEDAYRVREARRQILKLDQERAALDVRASQFAAQNQPQAMPGFENHGRGDAELAAQYRLSPDRFDAATGWTADANMSKKEKIETFLRNEQRYREDRASGRYRDDQGTVRR
jgi:hypothetical protein